MKAMVTGGNFKIAFLGRSGSGKDTAAGVIAKRFTFHQLVHQLAFADPVKTAVFNAFPLFDLSVYGKNDPIPELGGKSKRELWQTLGDSWGRNMVYKNIWVDALLRRMRDLEERNRKFNPSFVVTDVRRENEAKALIDEGFYLVKLIGKETLPDKLGNHATEHDVDYVDHHEVIENDYTPAFFDKINDLVDRVILISNAA